jgi:hypothetical protein
MQKAHKWLPEGWLVEIRAGGENMDKMFKVIFSSFTISYHVLVSLFPNE